VNSTAEQASGDSVARSSEDDLKYHVVVNHEEQYSVWEDCRGAPPEGWSFIGVSGSKAHCLEKIAVLWTDMRPLSLRRQMDADVAEPELADDFESGPTDDRDDLPRFLSTGSHPVEVSLRPARTVQGFRAAINRNYVHLKFVDTRGGTELGIELVSEQCRLEGADFDAARGAAHLEGNLVLDFVPMRCIADVDLATLSGSGRLVRR